MASFIHTARPSHPPTETTAPPPQADENENQSRPESSSSSPPSPPSGRARLRILCLHGGCHNGSIFRSQLSPLLEYLRGQTSKGRVPPVELVFCDGPLLNDGSLSYANMPGGEESQESINDPNATDPRQRMWFKEPSSSLLSLPKLEGVDASLLWLSQVWNVTLDSDPYHGILAFSQGASLAAMLPLITARHYVFSKLRFMILASG